MPPKHPLRHQREREKTHRDAQIRHDDRSLSSKVALCLAPDLLGLDFWRDNGMMYHVRAIDCVDGGHPVFVLVSSSNTFFSLFFLSYLFFGASAPLTSEDTEQELTNHPSSTENTHTAYPPPPTGLRAGCGLRRCSGPGRPPLCRWPGGAGPISVVEGSGCCRWSWRGSGGCARLRRGRG